MARQVEAEARATAAVRGCSPAARVTRSLAGYGVLAGPLYVVTSVAQAATRDGFDPRRHEWSLLAVGQHGWIQVANLVVSGAMTVAFAVGLRRAFGRGGAWAARLVGAYGVCLAVAGAFRADPARGFPSGTPDGPAVRVSGHGAAHLAAGGAGFLCLVVACLLVGRRFAAEGRRRWALVSRMTGVAFLAGFAGIASGSGGTAALLAFTAAVVLVSGWIAALGVHVYRHPEQPASRS